MKKIFAVILAGIIMFSMGSCAEKEKAPSESVIELADSKVKLPDITLTNKKVRILRTGMEQTSENEAVSLFKQKYGGEIEIVLAGTGGDMLKKLSNMVLSDDAPDLVAFEQNMFYTGITKKLFQPVNNVIDFGDELFGWLKEGSSYSKVGDDFYVLGSAHPVVVCWYNKKLFDDNGIDTPLKYFQEGTWTWTKLEALAEKMTFDTNKDKTVDIYGFGGSSSPLGSRLSAAGTDLIKVKNDVITGNLKDPAITKVFDTYTRLNKAGARHPANTDYDAFKKGNIAMFEGGIWASTDYKFQDQIKAGNISFVPMPRDEETDTYYYNAIASGYSVAQGAKNIEGTKAFLSCLEYIYYLREFDDNYAKRERTRYMEETGFTDLEMDIWKRLSRFEGFTQSVLMSEGVGGVDGWLGESWKMVDDVLVNNKPWATVRDQYSPILDAEIKRITLK